MNPMIGTIHHRPGGPASRSFHVAFRGFRRWSWVVAGLSSRILAPWSVATLNTKDFIAALGEAPMR